MLICGNTLLLGKVPTHGCEGAWLWTWSRPAFIIFLLFPLNDPVRIGKQIQSRIEEHWCLERRGWPVPSQMWLISHLKPSLSGRCLVRRCDAYCRIMWKVSKCANWSRFLLIALRAHFMTLKKLILFLKPHVSSIYEYIKKF